MDNDQYNSEKTEQRLQKILQGAFSGAPTPLKDIPTHLGEKRKAPAKKTSQPPRKQRQRKNRAA